MPFWSRLLTPRASDPAVRRHEGLLYVLALSATGASLVWLLAGLAVILLYGPYPRLIGDLIVGAEGLVLFPLAYLIGRRGACQVAIYLALIAVLLMQVTSMLVIWVNPLDPTLIFYALAIAVAGLLLGRRGAIAFYILSLLAYLATAFYLFYSGHNTATIEQPVTLLMITMMLALGLGVLLMVVHFYIRSMDTALQQAEEQVRQRTDQLEAAYHDLGQQHARLDTILRNVAEGLVVTDMADRLILANPAFAGLVGRPAEHLLGQSLEQVLPLEALNTLVAQARQHPATVASCKVSWAGRTYRAVACTLGERTAPPSGVVTILHDITPEVEAATARTEFISSVAHDLRVPLTSIHGYSSLLLLEGEHPLTAEQRSYAAVIQRNAERMAGLVRDLLDLCRLESGRVQVEIGPTSLYGAVEEVAAVMRPQLVEKGLAMLIDLPPALPPVLADPHRLNQVLSNLLSNACRYTPSGGQVSVTARFRPPPQTDLRHCPDESRGYLEVAVRDTGIGIPPEDQERIFERFVRLDHPMVEQAGGTGLGLTIARQLLHLQGGRIWVESTPGQGSTFYFTLPSAEEGPDGDSASVLSGTTPVGIPGKAEM